jgi:glycosyltransferase involved in cell wall biosynthesis
LDIITSEFKEKILKREPMIPKNGCIIIPAFNEEKYISNVVNISTQFLPTLVIDDGSKDTTAIIAEKNGARVFIQNPNQGKGAALQRGFKEALQMNYDFSITIDADGQHDVHEVHKFLLLYEKESPDLIIGFRDFSLMPFSRKLANSIGKWAFSWAMGMRILDNQSGYRLLSKRLMENVLQSDEVGFEFEVEVIVTCLKSGLSIGWVPIETIYGDEKSHIKPLNHIKNFFRIVLQTRKRMREKKSNL